MEDGLFCSFWSPSYRACYGLSWNVEDARITGLRFSEEPGGSQFNGRYA